MGVPSKLHIFFGNRLRGAANFHIRPVAFVNAVDGIAATSATSTAAGTAASSTTTRSLMIVIVLALSHDVLCLTFMLPLKFSYAPTGEQRSYFHTSLFGKSSFTHPEHAQFTKLEHFKAARIYRLKYSGKPARLRY